MSNFDWDKWDRPSGTDRDVPPPPTRDRSHFDFQQYDQPDYGMFFAAFLGLLVCAGVVGLIAELLGVW